MGTIFTNNDLAVLLAQRMGLTEEESRKFLETFFNNIAENVSEKKIVDVEGLGKFLKDNNSENLEFLPDENLNENVNKPFSYFEPQKIVDESLINSYETSHEVDKELLDDDSELLKSEDNNFTDEEKNESDTSENIFTATNEQYFSKENDERTDNSQHQELDKSKEIRFSNTELIDEFPSEENTHYKQPVDTNKNLWLILGAILSILLIAGIIFLVVRNSKYHPTSKQIVNTNVSIDTSSNVNENDSLKNIAIDSAVSQDADSKVDTASIQKIKTPAKITLKNSQTLHMVAKEYLGNSAFWVYIYLKNKSRISNPNNVPSGTILELPLVTEYDLSANNPNSIAEAKTLGNEVLKKFK